MNHREITEKILSDPVAKAAYEDMEIEFSLLRQMLKARRDAGLTQADVAAKMGTKAPAVTRLESSLGSGKHSPSLVTLQRYAEAVGCKLEVKLVRSSSLDE